MARNLKSNAKAERVDHRRPPIERMDREAIGGLLPPEELDRRPTSRLTAGDIKRAAARAKGVMGASKKLDPSLRIARARDTQPATAGMTKGRAAPETRRGPNKGSIKASSVEAPRRVRKSNAEIAEGDTSTARRHPAPSAAGAPTVKLRAAPKTMGKRAGGARQRAPAPGNIVTKTKRELVTGQAPTRKTGVKSTASTGGRKPPKRSARAGRPSGAGRSKGASGNLREIV